MGITDVVYSSLLTWLPIINDKIWRICQRKKHICSDRNQDGIRTGDAIDVGYHFCINQHWGYDNSVVGKASAGCLVRQSRQSHKDFMRLIKQDQCYKLNHRYVLMTTIIPGDDLANKFAV